jgi:enediyne biosynthesis protein E4
MELKVETLSSSCFMNDGNGNFTREDFPQELQLAPIFTFCLYPETGGNSFIAAGNFYGVIPFEGRYDAMNPLGFRYNKKTRQFGNFQQISGREGEFRDAKWVKDSRGTNTLVLARNNQPLVFMRP